MTLRNGERQVAPEISGIRRDHVARYEFAAARLPKGSRVLDIACGVGYGARILANHGHIVTAVDRSQAAIDYAIEHYYHPDVTYLATSIEHFDLAENAFDAVVCFETLEHLPCPAVALRRWLGASSMLIASVPNEAVFPHRGQIAHHHRHYTRGELSALLAETGWRPVTWYGQIGPESEVYRGAEGRTLIVVAEPAALTVAAPASVPAVEPGPPALTPGGSAFASRVAAAPPAHVAIVGLGPSGTQFFELTRSMGGVSAYCDEVWGINGIGDVLRCDRVFHMDDVAVQEARAAARPDSNIAAMVRWLKTHPGPIYTSTVRPGYPGMVPFPLEQVLNAGLDNNGGAPYFNSTVAYAIAYAVHIGVQRISLFGIDFTRPNAHHAEQGRACCEFWLGIASARGIAITVPDTSTMLDACAPAPERLYGYDGQDVLLHTQPDGKVKVEMRPRPLPSAAEIEARYDHTRHPNRLMQGDG